MRPGPARRAMTLVFTGVIAALVLAFASVAGNDQGWTKWTAVATAVVALVLVAVHAERRGVSLLLASVALAAMLGATPTDGDAVLRGVSIALLPGAIALAGLSINAAGTTAAVVTVLGAAFAGPILALFSDPFLDANCAGCRHSAFALFGDYDTSVQLAGLGWLAMAIGLAMLVPRSRHRLASAALALLAVVGIPGILVDRVSLSTIAAVVGALSGLVVITEKTQARHLLLELDGSPGGRSTPQALLNREEERLTAMLGAQVAELRGSRARVVRRADDERRKLERDLHDGAQQHVLALGFDLRTALAGHPDPDRAAALERCVALAMRALDELRELSHGVYPPLLAVAGLGPALRALETRSTAAITVGELPDRMPTSVERASYLLLGEFAERARAPLTVAGSIADGRFELVIKADGAEPSALLRERIAALDGTLTRRSGTWRLELPCE